MANKTHQSERKGTEIIYASATAEIQDTAAA